VKSKDVSAANNDVESGGESEKGSGRRSVFAFKATAATIGASLLSWAIAMSQSWYTENQEVLRRKSEEGAALQQQILEVTGRIEEEVALISADLKENTSTSIQRALTRTEGPLTRLHLEWQRSRLLLRNRAAQVYGRRFGKLIYNPEERSFIVDGCTVLVRSGDPQAGSDCVARRRAESARLVEFHQAYLRSDNFAALERFEHAPKSFDATFNTAYRVTIRYLNCVSRREQRPERCDELETLRTIEEQRSNLVSIGRTYLATRIVEASALVD
jgi:hypothetical protein